MDSSPCARDLAPIRPPLTLESLSPVWSKPIMIGSAEGFSSDLARSILSAGGDPRNQAQGRLFSYSPKMERAEGIRTIDLNLGKVALYH